MLNFKFILLKLICMHSWSQTTWPGSGVAMPTYSFCRQISTQEFEEQKLSVSQAALADLLENLIKDKTMSVKEKKKKLKLVFIYRVFNIVYAFHEYGAHCIKMNKFGMFMHLAIMVYFTCPCPIAILQSCYIYAVGYF